MDTSPTTDMGLGPFYPLLIHLAGGSDWAMFLIPNVCFFAALALLYVIAVRYMDADRARLTLWLISLGPAAMFFSYPYTESVFLLLTVGAFVLMETGHWLPAGLAGLAAAATRFPGVLVAAALGGEAAFGNRRRAVLVAIVLPVLGLVVVSLVDWAQMGDPLGFVHARSFWIGPDRNPLYVVGSFPKAVIEGDPFNPEAIGVPVLRHRRGLGDPTDAHRLWGVCGDAGAGGCRPGPVSAHLQPHTAGRLGDISVLLRIRHLARAETQPAAGVAAHLRLGDGGALGDVRRLALYRLRPYRGLEPPHPAAAPPTSPASGEVKLVCDLPGNSCFGRPSPRPSPLWGEGD